jgi:long-chain acyl-CoA synthetase
LRNIALEILTAAKSHGSKTALSHKQGDVWRVYTYEQMAAAVEQLAAGLVEQGIKPGDRVGIFAPNMPEWLIADNAILSIRAITVPIYATNTADQVASIANDSGMRLLLVGTEAEYSTAREAMNQCPAMENLVVMDSGFQPDEPHVLFFNDLLLQDPAESTTTDIEERRQSMASSDLATIIYTSGTTGQPKGVQLTHANFVNQHSTLDARFVVGAGDNSLCFLPLSHVYERSWSMYVLLRGATNTILSDPKQVIETLAEVRPTVMVSAPRLYDKIHAAIIAKADSAPPLRRKIFHWALSVGHEYWSKHYGGQAHDKGLQWRYKLADKLVLTKIRDVVGGPKNFLSSGGAALDRSVEDFFLKTGLLICQGYGLTETAPMLTCNSPGDFKFGTVGKPIDGVEIRIADTGEIQVKGPNVTSGYFGRPEANAEVFTEGWFRTGDIGHIDEDGFLLITDRIKDLIITSGGKNVAPQRIETLVGKDFYIDQLAVVGDKQKFISAIIVPAFENLAEFAKQRKLPFKNHEDLIKLPEVVELYTKRIREHSGSLAPFEKIKRFTLVARQFSQQAGEITPTLKVKRKVISEKYNQLIERMYSGENSGSQTK